MKKIIAGILITITFGSANAQQKHEYFSEKVLVDDQFFLPYYKGEIEKSIEGSYAPFFDELISIIQQDHNFRMPQGVKIIFSAYEKTLEIWVNPYMFDQGSVLADFGWCLSITLNQPATLVGSSVCSNIYNLPMVSGSFHGNKIYYNEKREVYVLTHFSNSLFIPASRSEFLENMIADEKKKEAENQTPSNNEILAQMNEAYQQLLKIDKTAAADYLKEMESMKKDLAGFDNASNKISNQLKVELESMPANEKEQQAYYAVGAYERYGKISGLLPLGKEEYGDPLIKLNPALETVCSSKTVQLITFRWNFMGIDSPADFSGEIIGNNLANSILVALYNNALIWQEIDQLIGK